MPTATLSTVEKAFRVLELFREYPRLGVSECARQLGIPRPSAHRMLATLLSAGVLERTGDGKYELGLRLFEIGTLCRYRRLLYDCACLPLETVVDATGLPAHLAVRDGDEALVLVKAHRQPHDRTNARAGTREPLHASALGKVLLANEGKELFKRLAQRGFERHTPYTITDVPRLLEELARIRQCQVAYSNEEYRLGLASLATTVRDGDGNVIGAVSLAAPSRHLARRRTALEPLLLKTAVAIETNLVRARSDSSDDVAV